MYCIQSCTEKYGENVETIRSHVQTVQQVLEEWSLTEFSIVWSDDHDASLMGMSSSATINDGVLQYYMLCLLSVLDLSKMASYGAHFLDLDMHMFDYNNTKILSKMVHTFKHEKVLNAAAKRMYHRLSDKLQKKFETSVVQDLVLWDRVRGKEGEEEGGVVLCKDKVAERRLSMALQIRISEKLLIVDVLKQVSQVHKLVGRILLETDAVSDSDDGDTRGVVM